MQRQDLKTTIIFQSGLARLFSSLTSIFPGFWWTLEDRPFHFPFTTIVCRVWPLEMLC